MSAHPCLDSDAWRFVFNAPLECGLRSVMLLAAAYPSRCDLQRLLQYDYLLVHSGDVKDGPASLHPESPQRSGELLVRRGLVERGLEFSQLRGLICSEWTERGLSYFAGEWSAAFLERLSEPYSLSMMGRAEWVIARFGSVADTTLTELMRDNWSNWGSEFETEALLRGEMT